MTDKKTKPTHNTGNIITRRRFIRDTSLAAVGSTLFLGAAHDSGTRNETIQNHSKSEADNNDTPAKSKVVLIRNAGVLDEMRVPYADEVQKMLDEAVCVLTGQKEPVAAWKTFIKPTDVVGIKKNRWPYLQTTPQVERAIKKRVMDAGVKEADIGLDDLRVLYNPIFKRATALINARPMRTHHWSGVGSLIKNYIMFDASPPSRHPDGCAHLGEIWHQPMIKNKTRLNILVMFTPQFHSTGPHSFSPKYVWPYYGLIVGFDPVAVDTIGLKIIQAKRLDYFKEERPINPPPKHIYLADTIYNLGTSDPNKIQLIKLGDSKDILI